MTEARHYLTRYDVRSMAERVDSLPTVILVEDDEDIARLVEHHLMAAGFATRWFRTASGVIAEAEKQIPALFLLDLMLPGTDGFQLCRSIRRHGSLGKLPVLILTARTGTRDRDLAFKSGADDFVTKPFSPADLISRVRALHEHRH